MTEHPILFRDWQVRAAREGRMTQTRRVIKPQPDRRETEFRFADDPGMWFGICPRNSDNDGHPTRGDYFRCPYGKPGDTLWPLLEIPSLGRNYGADMAGSIWSRARDGTTWRELCSSPDAKGYLTVTPAVAGRYTSRRAHRLVCEAFYGPPPSGKNQVRHLDGDPTNNAPDNLDWGSQEDNWTDRLAQGRGCGETHHSAKLMAADPPLIRALAAGGQSQRQLARKFGVSQHTIQSVLKGDTWAENPTANPPNVERWACRLRLLVTDVRAERVQDISEDDADAEGVFDPACSVVASFERHGRKKFAERWDSINGKRGYGWETNPWVWAVAFEVQK